MKVVHPTPTHPELRLMPDDGNRYELIMIMEQSATKLADLTHAQSCGRRVMAPSNTPLTLGGQLCQKH